MTLDFSEKELNVVDHIEQPYGIPVPIPVYDYPVSPKEASRLLYERKPVWQVMTNLGIEYVTFNPSILPDNHARAMVLDATTGPETNTLGGKDMFGIEWEYVPVAEGSMVKPGQPLIEDASEFREKVVWPDVESWDWEGSKAINQGYLDTDKFICSLVFNGWFERMISMMDFEGAIIALVDEDQKEDVHWFLDKLSDLYIKMLDKFITTFPQVDVFCIHDDWGSQQSSFFSPDVAAEMIVPHMKKVVDYVHSRGKFADLHSCGNIINMVPNMIEVGWDSWTPQEMNDTAKIHELYGDKLLIATMPEPFDPDVTSEDEQREKAREYAAKFCLKDKPSALSMYSVGTPKLKPFITPTFREELYKQSRIAYSA